MYKKKIYIYIYVYIYVYISIYMYIAPPGSYHPLLGSLKARNAAEADGLSSGRWIEAMRQGHAWTITLGTDIHVSQHTHGFFTSPDVKLW